MQVIRKRPGEPAEEIQIKDTLKALQEEVGGYIEAVTVTTDACIICDDEGRLKGKPHNCNLLGTDFVGTILVVGVSGDEFCDVPAGAWLLFNSKGRMTVCPVCGNEQIEWDYRFCPICGNEVKEKAPAGLAPEASAVVKSQLQDNPVGGKSQMEDDEDDFVDIKGVLKFNKTARKACKGMPCDTIQEFTCPLCGGKATAAKSSYNGHHHAGCKNCGISMME